MKEPEEKTIAQTLFAALTAHKSLIVAALSLIVLAVVLAVGSQLIQSHLNRKAQTIGESIADAVEAYQSASEAKETKPNAYANRKTELLQLLKKTEGRYPSRFAGYQWAMARARLFVEDERLTEAAEVLAACGKRNRHPLAPMMAVRASALYEDAGEPEAAKAVLKAVMGKSKRSPFYPEVAFNYARLLETGGELEAAKAVYADLAPKVPAGDRAPSDSSGRVLDYALLARSRIIAINLLLQEPASDAIAPDAH